MIFLFLFFIVLEFHVLVIKSTSYFLSKLSSTTVNMKALSFNNKQRFSKDNEFIYKQMTAYDLESSKLCWTLGAMGVLWEAKKSKRF
jgi:hypothetical protein